MSSELNFATARALLALVALLLNCLPCLAQSCTFSIGSLDFGNIDVTQNTAASVSGTYTASCSAIVSVGIRTCPNIGAGSGGGNASGNPRYLANGAYQLAYNLYTDAADSALWGSRLWVGVAPATDISAIVLGSGSQTRTVYAQIPPGQQAVPPGTYISSFAGQTSMAYQGYVLSPPSCTSLASPAGTATFTVAATVIANCVVAAANLDFGTVGVLSARVDASSSLTVTCTATTPYTISLDGGSSGATNPTQRKMKLTAESVTYGLYKDSARSQAWGNSAGVDTLSGVGTGTSQSWTIYGRVPTQSTPSPGIYSDTIVATITY